MQDEPLMPYRLLVLTDEIFPDAIGGIGKSLYTEAAALVKRGHSVMVWVRTSDPTLPAYQEIDGIGVHRILATHRSSPLYYLYPLVLFWKLVGRLQNVGSEFDLVVIHNVIFLFAAHFARLRRRFPIVYVFHASMGHEIRLNVKRGKYGRLTLLARAAAAVLLWGERWSYRRVDAMVARSHFMRDTLNDLMGGSTVKSVIIPVGLNLSLFPARDQREARLQLGLPQDKPILISVRRLVGRMGLENLIRAAALLRERGIDYLLLIAGKGYLHGELDALIRSLHLEDQVRLLGYVPEEQLPLVLASADLFVLPTEALEGFGLATIEALAVGLPVVGTPVGATPEILRPVDPELVTQSIEPQAIADSVIRWLTDDAGRAALRPHARAAVEAQYRDMQVVEQFESLFRECLDRSS